MTNHLNFFVPFQSAPAWHENQLTRALLVVLRYSPMAHQAWLQLVAPGRLLQTLPVAEFATQRQRVLRSQETHTDGEAVPGISVWLAPDAKQVNATMEPSDRQQVLDAIITYGSELVVVVENKISWCGPTEQPHRINLRGAQVKFEAQPRSVPWQNVFAMLADLVERKLVHGAERLVIGDFLDLVEAYFPNIGPYSTLSRCGTNRFRLERRLDVVQGVAVGVDEGKAQGWRDIHGTPKIFMAWLGYPSDVSAMSLRMIRSDRHAPSIPIRTRCKKFSGSDPMVGGSSPTSIGDSRPRDTRGRAPHAASRTIARIGLTTSVRRARCHDRNGRVT